MKACELADVLLTIIVTLMEANAKSPNSG